MTETVCSDKRRFSRILFDAPVTVVSGNRHWESRLIDISMKGALVRKPEHWDANPKDEFDLQVQLGDPDTCITMTAHIAHDHKKHIGFNCVHIDLNSVTLLKRLVELNLSDHDAIDRELAYLD